MSIELTDAQWDILQDNAKYCREFAAENYVEHPVYGTIPNAFENLEKFDHRDLKDLEPTILAALAETIAYKAADNIDDGVNTNVAQEEKRLTKEFNKSVSALYSVDSIKLLNISNALVFIIANDQEMQVVRLGPFTQAIMEDSFMNDHEDRTQSPVTLQPLMRSEFFDGAIRLDAMLPVAMIPDGTLVQWPLKEDQAFAHFIRQLYEGTCYQQFGEFQKDTGVLPDGTLVFLDPECSPYERWFYDLDEAEQQAWIKKSNDLIFDRLQHPRIPDEFRFLVSDGQGSYRYKQEKFFQAPQASANPPASTAQDIGGH